MALDNRCVELWDVAAGSRVRELAHGGHTPVQLLGSAGRLLVHMFDNARSTLLEVNDDALVPWHELPGQCTCSVDAHGRILARDVRRDCLRWTDRVIANDGEVLCETDLGAYDVFNHYLRIDGGDTLYFLRGTPPLDHQRKVLCTVAPSGPVREVMTWDTEDHQLMTSVATLVDGDLVRAYVVYDPRSRGQCSIERITLAGRVLWRHDVAAGATALCTWPAAGAIAFALLDGTFGVIDAQTGALLHEEQFALDGVPTIVTALAVHDETIVLGTIQGRLLLFALR